MVVLVSPSNYHSRKTFYGDYCTVKPLLFRWQQLTAQHIKCIMRVNESDNQLYMATMLDLLRRYQRQGSRLPTLEIFIEDIKAICNVKGQSGPLLQRIALLESILQESTQNHDLVGVCGDLYSECKQGCLVVVDLTDPLLADLDANGIFQVLVEQYRTLRLPPGCGRLLALDEAHKFMHGEAEDGLSNAIVNIARLMRHDGIRLVVSTQSPKALAPELLELVTVAVLHRFHSRDWFSYLSNKLPLAEKAWERILTLSPGEALVFASRHLVLNRPLAATYLFGLNTFAIKIRPRITADRGASVVNRAKKLLAGGGGGGGGGGGEVL